MVHITEIVDDVVDRIRHKAITARGAAEGSARGLVRELLVTDDTRPEEFTQAWRQLVSLVGRETANELLNEGRELVASLDR